MLKDCLMVCKLGSDDMNKRQNNLGSAQQKTYMQLAADNRKATQIYNEGMLSVLTLMGGLMLLLPLLFVPFSATKATIAHIYVQISAVFFSLFLLFRLQRMKKHILLGLYTGFSVFFAMAIYLSVVHSPHMRATILLGVFCIMPLAFIDRPIRMHVFAAFWFMVHTVLAFYLKPEYALDDTINCLGFALLGCFMGSVMVRIRLESYEAHRLLTIEKEVDVLTGLANRRKLFETLSLLEETGMEKPTGIFMVDIDHFKELNDCYGHAAGNRCLHHFGAVLITFMQNFQLQFYRYGGEEFVAMAYGYSAQELLSIAESLRIAVQSTDMDGHQISISIGVAYCGDEQVKNYEHLIDCADKAVYEAKRAGRNRVCMEGGRRHRY